MQINMVEKATKVLIDCMRGSYTTPWQIDYLIRECKSLLAPDTQLGHVYREGNKITDHLRIWHHCGSMVFNAMHNLPQALKNVLAADFL